MKLLFITQYYRPEIGATPVRLHAIAKELQRQGHSVRVVTGMPNYPTGHIFEGYRGKLSMFECIDDVEVYRAWLYPARGTGLVRLLNYLSFMGAAFPLLLRVSRGMDFIIAESPPPFPAVTALAVSTLTDIPVILNVADLWPEWPMRAGILTNPAVTRPLAWLSAYLYRSVAFINCVTSGIATELRSRYDVAEGKLLYLPNGVDTSLFTPTGPQVKDGRKLFVYAGNHGIYNWPIVIAQAARLLSRKRSDIKFLLVGDGSQKPEVRRYVERFHVDNIELADSVPLEEVPRIYRTAYAALVTYKSNFLSRPAKLLPAMACGLPIVYSGDGEGADLVRAAGCGIVVPPEDPAALARAVERVSDDYHSAVSMGAIGAQLAQSEYSWSSIVTRWVTELSAKSEVRSSTTAN